MHRPGALLTQRAGGRGADRRDREDDVALADLDVVEAQSFKVGQEAGRIDAHRRLRGETIAPQVRRIFMVYPCARPIKCVPDLLDKMLLANPKMLGNKMNKTAIIIGVKT